jgi:NADH dehydrogenase
VVSIREFTGSCTFRMAEVEGVDTAEQTVTYRMDGAGESEQLSYDHLVIALGSVTRVPPVPGLAEHSYELKNLGEAVALRDHAIRLLERADAAGSEAEQRRLLHFVVVGGSFTGVEVAGEFDEFLHDAARYYPGIDRALIRMTLVEISDRILPALDEGLSAYAARKLAAREVDIRLGRSVAAVAADHVRLDDGLRLDTKTVIWCAGIAPSPVIAELSLPVDDLGYVLCEPDLRVRDFDNVWSIGDVAINPDPRGRAYAPTAQNAVRQGSHLARTLLRLAAGEAPRPFVHRTIGTLAALGCRTGVAKIFGIKLSGFAAWFLWRSVYLAKMPGLARKARVAIDWTLDLVFGREIVQLGVHRG